MGMYGPPQGMPYGTPQGGPHGGPTAGPPPKKKGLSTGCLIAIVVVMGFFLTIGGIVLYAGYRVSQDKDVQNVFGAIGDAAKIAAEAQTAPGTAELRAIGCEQALAMDPAKIMKIADRFSDAGPPPVPPGGSNIERVVVCQVNVFGTAPRCDDAARAYVSGASPAGNFMLSVQHQGGSKSTVCSGVYSPTGTLVKTVGAGAAP